MTPVELLVSSLCVWKEYMLGTPLPYNALIAGSEGPYGVDYWPVYVARARYNRTLVPLKLNARGAYGSSEYRYVWEDTGDSETIVEVLVCNLNGKAKLHWIQYRPKNTSLEHCVQFGKDEHGETVYLGRAQARREECEDDKNYITPGGFTASQGMLPFVSCTLMVKLDFQVLCLLSIPSDLTKQNIDETTKANGSDIG